MIKNSSVKIIAFSALLLGALAPSLLGQAHGTISDAALSAKKLQVAPGLKVELFASEPLLANPVAFDIDEKGRFFIAETHRYKDAIFDITANPSWLIDDLAVRTVADREAFLKKAFGTNVSRLAKDSELIRLVEDRDGDGHAETSSVFADGFNEITSGTAAGILARHGDVWFTCIPDLWKFSVTNATTGQGSVTAGTRQKLYSGFGSRISVSGHDLHGLALGPDGKIYFSCGDRGFCVTNHEGVVFCHPETGGVFRCNRDGSDLELFCIGTRNPQGLTFDAYGNLFTDDNDTAGPDDSRVIYIVQGADYGWRGSYQYQTGFGPWVEENVWKGNIDDALPWAGFVAQGPAGIAFYPGTGLPDKYKNHFFGCDFPKGVKSFTVKPKGAAYEVTEVENFLTPLGATHAAFGPDSSLYVSDWGMAYTMPDAGRIYRVFDPAQKTNAAIAEVKALLADGMEKKSVGELTNLIGHADMRIRLEAQFELVRRDALQTLAEVLVNETNQFARIHAIWGIGQLAAGHGTQKTKPMDALSPLVLGFSDKDSEIRAQAAKALASAQPEVASAANEEILKLLTDATPRVRFYAAMALANSASTGAANVVEMLRANDNTDPYLVHAGVWALLKMTDFDVASAAQDKSVAVRRAALLWMRRKESPDIATFLKDPEPRLIVETARAINDVPIEGALPDLAGMLTNSWALSSSNFNALSKTMTAPYQQLIRRAINANFRLGETTNAAMLASFSVNENIPEPLRIEALEALADWEKPNPLDRVMGLYRPLPNRDADSARDPFRPALTELFQSNSEKILIAMVQALRKLEMSETTLLIRDLFGTNHSPELRVESLATMAHFNDDSISDFVKAALVDPEAAIRREGIKHVEQVNPTEAAPLLDKLFTDEKDLRIKQTVLATLGTLKSPAADDVLARMLDDLLAGKTPPELQLDLLDAATKRNSDPIKQKLHSYEASLPKDDALAPYRVALAGGDAEAGKKIFHERDDVGCLRCHAIHKQGGTVGPDLGGLATRKPRDYMLESIVFPNKQIAQGFESVVLTMKNGSNYAGTVKSETDTELVLNSPEDGVLKLKKADIAKRIRSLSPMPEGLAMLLTKKELRDVVEYLSTLK